MTPRRLVPYPAIGAVMYVPDDVWHRSLAIAREYRKEGAEALMLWGGVVCAGAVTVTGLYVPRHSVQGYGVALTASESRWLLRRLRDRDEKLLAQVHSHPFEAFHSAGDDEGAASFHVGYLSIVIPRFGRSVAMPTDCAVFEYDGARFIQLEDGEIASRIVIVANTEELDEVKQNNADARTHRKRDRDASNR